MRLSPAPVRSRTRGARTATGPRPGMIARWGRWPWRTSRWRPSPVCLSAWPLRKAATSASTACANSARAPSRRTSVSGSENSAGWISLTTVSWIMACHSFGGEVEVSNTPTIRRLIPHAVTNFRAYLAPHHRVRKASQILQALVIPGGRHPPAADGLPDRRRGRGADRRQEADEVSPPPVLRPSRLEGVAEEVERDVFILTRPVVVLAVDDPGLRGMKLQTAVRQTTPDGLQHRPRLRLAPAMDECIVRVALEPEVRVDPRHPAIERVVQEEVGQKWRPLGWAVQAYGR